MKPVSQYIDFREYLRDFYRENKKRSRLSFRAFSKRAGFTSPSFIKLVIEGKANVRLQSITKLSKAMRLPKDERRYFKYLALFGQAKDIETKIRYLERLKGFQGSMSVSGLTDEHFDYFSKWYHPIIKELLDITEFKGDYEGLARMVNPPISADEAKESVQRLLRLQLIKEENGRFSATRKFLTTEGLGAGTLAVTCMQKKMAHLAAEAVDTVPKENRDISGISVSISPKSFDKIKDELSRCRRRIFEIAAEDRSSNAVYRVNLYLFPISASYNKFGPHFGHHAS